MSPNQLLYIAVLGMCLVGVVMGLMAFLKPESRMGPVFLAVIVITAMIVFLLMFVL